MKEDAFRPGDITMLHGHLPNLFVSWSWTFGDNPFGDVAFDGDACFVLLRVASIPCLCSRQR